MQEKMLDLDDIIVDNSLNPREGALDQEKVVEYSQHISELPLMHAYYIDGGPAHLTRGFHRFAAHQLAGWNKAKFIIHDGSRLQAEEHADLDNLTHGINLTRAEKRAVIARHVKRHPERADAWLARETYTTDKTVRSVREELEAAGEIEVLHKLTGMDGIERPRSIEQPKRSAEVDSSQQALALDDPHEEMTEVKPDPAPAEPQPASQWLDPAPADAPQPKPGPKPDSQPPASLTPPPAKAALPKPAASYRLSILIKAGAPAVVDVWQMNGDNRAINHQEVEDWGTLPGVVGQLVSELEV